MERFKSKKAILAILLALLVIGTLTAMAVYKQNKDADKNPSETSIETILESESKPAVESSMAETSEKNGDQSETKESLEPETKETSKGEEQDSQGKKDSSADQTSKDDSSASDKASKGEEQGKIQFPYQIPDTNLTIESISSYSGLFLEDGSDEEISDVAALIVKNNSSSDIEYAKIQLSRGDREYTFILSDLPGNSRIVVQESERASVSDTSFDNCLVDLAENELVQSSEEISVTERSDGTLVITNLTDSDIPCVRVFYKFYMEDENAYVGGITYTAKLTDLAANDSQQIDPTHYTSGNSRVVMVRTYDDAE